MLETIQKGGRKINVIYIDVLFGVNMFVHYFLLLACSKICKCNAKFLRLFSGSLVATLFTAVIFLPEIHWTLSLIIRLIISCVVTFATFGFSSVTKYFSRLFCFYSVSFGYAGIVLGLWILVKPKGVLINNGAVYIDVSPYVLLVSFCVGYFCLLLLRKYFGTDISKGDVFKMKIFFNEKCLEIFVLYDTGNKLRDMFSDLPVAIINEEKVREILPKNLELCLAGMGIENLNTSKEFSEKFRVIPYHVIGGGGVLPALKCDRAELYKNHKKIWENKCIIGISKEIFDDDINGIIGEDFIKC